MSDPSTQAVGQSDAAELMLERLEHCCDKGFTFQTWSVNSTGMSLLRLRAEDGKVLPEKGPAHCPLFLHTLPALGTFKLQHSLLTTVLKKDWKERAAPTEE